MDARAATLIMRYRAADGAWKRASVVRSGNGRIKTGFALIDGKPTQVECYQYQVRYYVDRKVMFEPAGTNATEAEIVRRRIEERTTAIVIAERAGLEVVVPTDRKRIRESAVEYIERAESANRLEAAAQARNVADEFIALMARRRKSFIDEIQAEDIYAFHNLLRSRGCEDRTVANKHARLKSWLRFAGAGAEATDGSLTPAYEEKVPTIYSRDQINRLLQAANPYKQLMILLAYKCGLREQEMAYLCYFDIDYERKVLKVQGKKYTDIYPKAEAQRVMEMLREREERSARKLDTVWAFRVKDKEQREIPLTDDLIEALRARRSAHPRDILVLGTSARRPNTKLLKGLKVLARKAGLNCGRCEGCRSKSQDCHEYTLHRFRRTYMTTLLRNGVDLKTVQSLVGHADLQSTMRYLRQAEGDELHAQVNSVAW